MASGAGLDAGSSGTGRPAESFTPKRLRSHGAMLPEKEKIRRAGAAIPEAADGRQSASIDASPQEGNAV